MPGTISRRFAVGLLGASGLAGVLAGHSVSDSVAGVAQGPALAVGQRFARWTISAVHPIQDGALRVGVKGADDHEFTLEILARDTSPLAVQPPACTEALAIFVRNGGDGWAPTAEEQGLAAMTLAQALSVSGQGGAIAGLLTHSERVVRHEATLIGEVPGALRRSV